MNLNIPSLVVLLTANDVVQHSFVESIVQTIVPEIIGFIELIGIFVIVVGSIKAFIMYFRSVFKKAHYPVKLTLGNSLALGLEFKMGAEILKTVIIRDKEEIMMLAAIIVLRAILSVLIHFEVKSEKAHGVQDATASDY